MTTTPDQRIESGIRHKKEARRRKLLGLLSIGQIQDLSEAKEPWHATRSYLTERILSSWNEQTTDEVKSIVESLLRQVE